MLLVVAAGLAFLFTNRTETPAPAPAPVVAPAPSAADLAQAEEILRVNQAVTEILSLLAAGLAQPDTVQFSSIPLAPLKSPPPNNSKQPPGGLGPKGTPLRHIASDAPSPLWPSP